METRFPRRREKTKPLFGTWKVYLFIGFFFFAFYLFFLTKPGLLDLYKYTMVKNKIEKQIEHEGIVQDSLRQEIAIFQKDSATQEKYLREKYNYGKKGEKVYREMRNAK